MTFSGVRFLGILCVISSAAWPTPCQAQGPAAMGAGPVAGAPGWNYGPPAAAPGEGILAPGQGLLGRGGFLGTGHRPVQHLVDHRLATRQAAGAPLPHLANTGWGTATVGWIPAAHGEAGFPAAARSYPPYFDGGPQTPTPWEADGSGYVNYGDTCCGPHWYDFMAQNVWLRREGLDARALMSDGIRGLGPPNTILSTADMDFSYEPAYRLSGRFQLSAVHSVEAIHLGGLDWDDRATRTTTNNSFYSSFSDFGNLPFGGFEDSDQANITSLFYDSELDSVEINFRRGWILPQGKTSGSWLMGIRYLRLDEALQHDIQVQPHFDPINMVDRFAEFTNYSILARNHLLGAQVGTELTGCLLPGVILGGEAKAGVYGNNARQSSNIVSTTLPTGLAEAASDTGAAFVSEAQLFLLFQVHPLWKLRCGYEVMFLEGLATAESNYNSAPFLATSPSGAPVATPLREVDINDHDELLLHGFHVGLEFGW